MKVENLRYSLTYLAIVGPVPSRFVFFGRSPRLTFCEVVIIMKLSVSVVFSLAALIAGHDHHDQAPIVGPHKSLWYNTLPGDGGTQVRSFLSDL